jgi:teichoic acid transport system permease protein
MRFMMFFSGVIWRLDESFPRWFARLMDLNPFSYIITGFRYTFFGQALFWQHWETTIFFWLLILLIAIIASHLHLKLRAKFIDLT